MRKTEAFTMLIAVAALCLPSVTRAEESQGGDRRAHKIDENILSVVPVPDGAGGVSSVESTEIQSRESALEPGPMIEPARLRLENAPAKLPALENSGVRSMESNPVNDSPGQVDTKARAQGAMPPLLKSSVPADARAVREGLRAAGVEKRDPALVQQARQAGTARLTADRGSLRGEAMKPEQATRTVSASAPDLARKTPLLPLPSAPSSTLSLNRQKDIERLTEAIQNADNADEKDRRRLDLAAAYVGAGQIAEARGIYQDLADHAKQKDVRQTASRNLRILAGEPRPAVAADHAPPQADAAGKVTKGRVEK